MWAGTLMKLAGVTVTVKGAENIPTDRAVVFTPITRAITTSP